MEDISSRGPAGAPATDPRRPTPGVRPRRYPSARGCRGCARHAARSYARAGPLYTGGVEHDVAAAREEPSNVNSEALYADLFDVYNPPAESAARFPFTNCCQFATSKTQRRCSPDRGTPSDQHFPWWRG